MSKEFPVDVQGSRSSSAESSLKVELSFLGGDLSKPRWSFTRNERLDGFQELVSIGPSWIISEPKNTFLLCIELVDKSLRFESSEIFHSTKDSDPVKFDLKEDLAKVCWGPSAGEVDGIWVYRLFVSRSGVSTMPVHLTYIVRTKQKEEEIIEEIKSFTTNVRRIEIRDLSELPEDPGKNDTVTISTGVEFEGEHADFCDWIKLRNLALPDWLKLEPQIVTKGAGQNMVFHFVDRCGQLGASATPDPECDPPIDERQSLAMRWRFVSAKRDNCPGPREFLGSSVVELRRPGSGEEKLAIGRVHWRQPRNRCAKSVACFLFLIGKDLVDPTVIHDPYLPP